jgi:hypothetical protein
MEGSVAILAVGTRSADWVVTITLDWLLQHLPVPQVLKIDVEGLEHCVLGGESKLLSEVRPRVWCEVTPKNTDQVTSILQSANYAIYNANVNPPTTKVVASCCLGHTGFAERGPALISSPPSPLTSICKVHYLFLYRCVADSIHAWLSLGTARFGGELLR